MQILKQSMLGVLKEQHDGHYGWRKARDKGGDKVREGMELGHIGPLCHCKAYKIRFFWQIYPSLYFSSQILMS